MSPELTRRPEWLALQQHFAEIGSLHLRDLFAADPARGERFSAEAAGLYLDYSRQRISADTLRLLGELAEACALPRHIAAMFRGDLINTTEHRAALHVALRAPAGEQIWVDGHDVVADVHTVLTRMEVFAEAVRNGSWLGYTGQPVRNIVSIGIGGSDLGPVMAYEALRATAATTCACASCRTWTALIWPKPCATSMPPKPSSSSARKPSPPSKP